MTVTGDAIAAAIHDLCGLNRIREIPTVVFSFTDDDSAHRFRQALLRDMRGPLLRDMRGLISGPFNIQGISVKIEIKREVAIP